LGVPDSAQAVVTAIIKATPDLVYFGGGTAAAAQLRGTLSLTGAPGLVILAVGQAADHPDWGTAVGVAVAAANTTALLPVPDLSTLDGAKDFIAAYQTTYAGQVPLPQAALAYDAAMDEIAAIKSLVRAGKQVTRAAVLAAVASAKYAGVSGTLAFDAHGDNTTALGFSLYTCDAQGAWHFVTAVKG
jgi:branched-chain amino acid transport system substrate-binding protein